MAEIDGWITTKVIDTVAKMKAGGTPSRSNPNYWRGEIPFVLIEDMTKTERFLTETSETISELGLNSSSAWIVPENSLLLSMYATLGKVVINKIPVATNQAILGMIPGRVDRDFLFYLLQFSADKLAKLNSQTTQKNLNKLIVSEFEVTYPVNPAEQRQIADILSTLDEAIAQSESLVRKYQSIKQGLISDLLTRGVDENGELRNPDKYPTQFEISEFGLFPKVWEITTLGKIIARSKGIIQTGPFGTQMHAYDYVEDGIPTMMPQNIDETGWINLEELPHLTEHKARELKRHALKVNDVIFARRGELSKCSAIDNREENWICGSDFMLVRVPSNVMNGKWFAHYYRNDICQRQVLAQAVGSTMRGINTCLMSSLIVALPDVEEQKRIVAIFKAQEELIEEETVNHNKILSLKQGLMQDLLSGQVRVGW